MIGSCDCCNRQKVPVSTCFAFGIETTACFICRGDDDPDPYGELDEIEPNEYVRADGQFGVGA